MTNNMGVIWVENDIINQNRQHDWQKIRFCHRNINFLRFYNDGLALVQELMYYYLKNVKLLKLF